MVVTAGERQERRKEERGDDMQGPPAAVHGTCSTRRATREPNAMFKGIMDFNFGIKGYWTGGMCCEFSLFHFNVIVVHSFQH